MRDPHPSKCTLVKISKSFHNMTSCPSFKMKLLADERSIPNHRVGLDFLTQQYVNILVMLLVGDFNGRSPLVLFRVKKNSLRNRSNPCLRN